MAVGDPKWIAILNRKDRPKPHVFRKVGYLTGLDWMCISAAPDRLGGGTTAGEAYSNWLINTADLR